MSVVSRDGTLTFTKGVRHVVQIYNFRKSIIMYLFIQAPNSIIFYSLFIVFFLIIILMTSIISNRKNNLLITNHAGCSTYRIDLKITHKTAIETLGDKDNQKHQCN